MPSAVHASQTKVIIFALILIGVAQRSQQQQPEPDFQSMILRTQQDTRFTQFLRDNCLCTTELACECCGRYDNDMLNIHQSLCLNWVIDMQNSSMHTVVKRNAVPLIANIFNIFPLPPFCMPLAPLPLNVCFQVHSIMEHPLPNSNENALHACADVKLSFFVFDLFSMPLGCMDFSSTGIMPH